MPDYTEIADPPRQCVIETVTACALKCPACYIGSGLITRPKKIMSWELFSRIADQIEPFVKHVYLHLWGEPLSCPHLKDMIRRVRQFATVDVSTHGQLVTEEIAEWLCEADTLAVSMEGLDQETYEKYRVGGSFEKAMNALRILSDRRKTLGMTVNWTYVVTVDTEPYIEEARKIAESMGNVTFGAKSAYFTSPENRERYEPLDEQYRRYNRDGSLKADRHSCKEWWTTIYFTPTGAQLSCCYEYNAQFSHGNIMNSDLMDIWNGPGYRAMRRKMLSGELHELCANSCGMP